MSFWLLIVARCGCPAIYLVRGMASHRHQVIRRKRLTGALRGYTGRLQPATATYRPATERRPANTAAWQVRPTQVVRVIAPVALG